MVVLSIRVVRQGRTARVASAALACLIAGFFTTTSVQAGLIIGSNFTGSSLGISRFIPPDTMGAIGPGHFAEMINGRYQVYTRGGVVTQSKTLDAFWTSAGVTFNSSSFDPRIVYDHDSGRWFAASVERSAGSPTKNDVLVAVSSTSDPTGAWTGFKVAGGAARFTDFPTLGVDRDGVYISTNDFHDDATFSVSVISIPKSSLTAGVPSTAGLAVFNGESASSRGFAIQPAVDFGPSDGRAALLAHDVNVLSVFNRTDVLGAAAAGATLSASTDIAIPGPGTSSPPLATQPDGSTNLQTGGVRIMSSVFEQGDSLWASSVISSGGRAAVQWYEISEVTNAVLQSGVIGDALHDYFYPSISANSFGEVVIGFSRSGLTEFASSYAVGGTTAAGITTFGAPILLKAGVANYRLDDSIGRNRWGDYSATTRDPLNERSFWTIQEWASATNVWSTQITQLTFDTQPPTAVPEPGSLALLGISVIGMVGYGWRRRRQTVEQ